MMNASANAKNAEVEKPKICIATLTDEKKKSFLNRILAWRNFDGIMQMTWDNKFQYARQHGYRLFDESAVVDNSRPLSWFKILAVR
jgi:galactosyl transferase GMA12/MNN10 family